MKRALFPVTAIAFVCAAILAAPPAEAQSRVFVAAQGSDSNPCTFAQPCRSFQQAHDTVTARGEIDVLDPAGYGALTITKSISIQGHGFAGLAVPSGDGITVNAGPGDEISVRGLLLDGVGTGANGIVFNSGGSLNVQDCLIRNFGNRGITFPPAATSSLFVSNTILFDNAATGIGINPTAAGIITVILDHVVSENNGVNGITVQVAIAATATVVATIDNSVSAGNASNGILISVSTSGSVKAMVRNSTLARNDTG